MLYLTHKAQQHGECGLGLAAGVVFPSWVLAGRRPRPVVLLIIEGEGLIPPPYLFRIMDILYIVKGGATGGTDAELRCSLRSLAEYGRGVGRVIVAGSPPAWLSDAVVRVPVAQPPVAGFADKGRNIIRTAMAALERVDIGEDFLVSMDDHYLAAPVDFDNYPYYCREGLAEDGELPRDGGYAGSYREYLYNTRLFLEGAGLPTKAMALHRNMWCSRRWIAGARGLLENMLAGRGDAEPWMLLLNWAIAHEGITPTIVRDCKIRDQRDWGVKKAKGLIGAFFSTEDFGYGSWMHRRLLDTFPKKSIYERE